VKQAFKLNNLIKFIFNFGIVCFFIIILIFLYFAKDLPDPNKINEIQRSQSTKIYDRTGEILLYEIYDKERRTIISINELPDYVKNATIVTEDIDFYHHHGIKFTSLIRALINNITHQNLSQGGSTITQQLIKNIILTNKKSFIRKIQEIILALELERKYSKNQILEFYLNQIPYGSNLYGIESASQSFFEKPAKNLTIAESALLAALLKAPSYYSPYGNHKDLLFKRKNEIIKKLYDNNYISKIEYENALNEQIIIHPPKIDIKAPHFVMYIKEYLENKYGIDFLKISGLKITTTLDYNLQKKAEEILQKQAALNDKLYNAKNASMVAIDPKTGQILVMVGSKNYFDIENDGNVNVTLQPRQPGSAFKPIVYATAFKKGFTPNTIVFDVPTEFSTDSQISFKPQNYDETTRGPVTLKNALAQSLNIPSVKVLYLAGIDESINTAESLGITTLKPRNRFGLSLVLGGGEVKLLELTNAYSAFAQDGKQSPITGILKIEDANGNILEEFKNNSSQILDQQIARNINDILSDNEARKPIFGENSYLKLKSRPAAAKTGTTSNYRDAWVIGYTPSLVTGVWVGNNNNKEMKKGGAGISAAGPIWNKFMEEALKDTPIENFIPPEPIITGKAILDGDFANTKIIKLDKLTKLLATEYTPDDYIEEKQYKEVHNILYYVDKNNPRGEAPLHPENDPQFYNWEEPVLKWVNEQNSKPNSTIKYNLQPPTEYDYIHTKENKPKITILEPNQNITITEKELTIKINVVGTYKIKQVNYLLDNNQLLNTNTYSSYESHLFLPDDIENGNHFIKIYASDEFGNFNEENLYFNLQ